MTKANHPKYTSDGVIQWLFTQPIGTARGVIPQKAEGSYLATVPTSKDERVKKFFPRSKYGSMAYSSAIRWVMSQGIKVWGEPGFCRYMRGEVRTVAQLFNENNEPDYLDVFEGEIPKHYGVTYLGKGTFRAKIRIPEQTSNGGYKVKTFGYSKYKADAFSSAVEFVEQHGVAAWGGVRWDDIKQGNLRRYTSKDAGVRVEKRVGYYETAEGYVGEYQGWVVAWREIRNETEATEWFGSREFGTLEQAELAANWFAVRKRAERTKSELKLPSFLVEKLYMSTWV